LGENVKRKCIKYCANCTVAAIFSYTVKNK